MELNAKQFYEQWEKQISVAMICKCGTCYCCEKLAEYEQLKFTEKIHKSITLDRIIATLEDTLQDPGICIACGDDQSGCEGDAENYECDGCGEYKVFGVSGLLMHLL